MKNEDDIDRSNYTTRISTIGGDIWAAGMIDQREQLRRDRLEQIKNDLDFLNNPKEIDKRRFELEEELLTLI
jgi:hypothetical protein